MRKITILAALALLVPSVRAQQPQLTDLPGMKMDASAAAVEADLSGPDAQKILSGLTAELRLSSKQEERITAAIGKESKKFNKLLKEYEKGTAEENKWRNYVGDLKFEMGRINTGVPDVIRDFLDDDQRQAYDALLAARNKPAEPEVVVSTVSAEPAAEAAQPVKKRKRVKRKKPKAVGKSSDALSPAPLLSGNAPAAGKSVSKPGKKRVLKKKTAVPAPEIANDAPAGAQPTGKEGSGDDEGYAGSYP